MKPTGIIRRIDDLGRIVIPKEIRRVQCVRENDPIEIYATDEGILLKKYDSTKSIKGLIQELEEIVLDAHELEQRHTLLGVIKDFKTALCNERKE